MAACGGATAEGLAEWKGWMVAGGARARDGQGEVIRALDCDVKNCSYSPVDHGSRGN